MIDYTGNSASARVINFSIPIGTEKLELPEGTFYDKSIYITKLDTTPVTNYRFGSLDKEVVKRSGLSAHQVISFNEPTTEELVLRYQYADSTRKLALDHIENIKNSILSVKTNYNDIKNKSIVVDLPNADISALDLSDCDSLTGIIAMISSVLGKTRYTKSKLYNYLKNEYRIPGIVNKLADELPTENKSVVDYIEYLEESTEEILTANYDYLIMTAPIDGIVSLIDPKPPHDTMWKVAKNSIVTMEEDGETVIKLLVQDDIVYYNKQDDEFINIPVGDYIRDLELTIYNASLHVNQYADKEYPALPTVSKDVVTALNEINTTIQATITPEADLLVYLDDITTDINLITDRNTPESKFRVVTGLSHITGYFDPNAPTVTSIKYVGKGTIVLYAGSAGIHYVTEGHNVIEAVVPQVDAVEALTVNKLYREYEDLDVADGSVVAAVNLIYNNLVDIIPATPVPTNLKLVYGGTPAKTGGGYSILYVATEVASYSMTIMNPNGSLTTKMVDVQPGDIYLYNAVDGCNHALCKASELKVISTNLNNYLSGLESKVLAGTLIEDLDNIISKTNTISADIYDYIPEGNCGLLNSKASTLIGAINYLNE